MIIEFDTIRSSYKESHERDIAIDLNGAASVPFHRSEDYMTQIAVDMDRIVDFSGGRVFFNDQEVECVFAYDDEGNSSTNLLMTYKEFKKVFEYATGKKIVRHEEV